MHLELMRDPASTFPSVASPEGIRSLRVWHCKYRTLRALQNFPKLQGLEIASFPDASLEVVSGLHDLRYLRILHLPKVTSLAPLAALTSLRTLRLSTLPSWDSSRRKTTVESLMPLAQLSALRHLELLGVVPSDESLRPLEACSLETARFHLIPKAEIARFFGATQAKDAHAPLPDF